MANSYTLASYKDTSFTARDAVTDTLTNRFDIRNSASDTFSGRFDIRQLALYYKSFSPNSFTSTSYRTVDEDINLTSRFDIRQGEINSHITNKFNIRQAITDTLTNRFDIRQIVSDTLTLPFGLYVTVANTLTNLFNIREATSDTLTNKFHIREQIGILGSYIDNSFTTASYTIADLSRTFRFDIRPDGRR